MSQSKRASGIEVFTNVTCGYILAIGIQMVVFPWFNLHVNIMESAILAAFFTGISMLRGYIVRRIFNWLHVEGILR